MQDRIDQCAMPMPGCGMDDEAGRLVEAEDMVVLEEDFERNVLGGCRVDCLGRWKFHIDSVALF